MPVARRAAALPGSWDRSRSSSSWRAARSEIIPRTYSRAPAAPPAAGGPGRRAREGRGPLEAGRVSWPWGACDPPRWLCAVLLRPLLRPASHPKARTKETRSGFPRFPTPGLGSGSEQDRTDPRPSCPSLTLCFLEPGLENPLFYTKHLPTKQVHVAGCLAN